jgi:uncharacterized protein (TIGR02996 family)
MPDEQAFLAALAAAPGDDTTRLVFADWLDEHGEPDKAEYLRLVVGLVPPFKTGKGDPPETARVVSLSERLPQDWRLASAARFTAVLYGTDPGQKIVAIKLVRELTGMGLKEAKEFVESVPARFPTRTTLEAAIGIRDRFLRPGFVVAVHPADLGELPGLASYEIVACLHPYQQYEDGWYELTPEAFDSFRDFLVSAMGISADRADSLARSDRPVTVSSRLEAAQVEKRMTQLRSMLPTLPENPTWGVEVYSYCQLEPASPRP